MSTEDAALDARPAKKRSDAHALAYFRAMYFGYFMAVGAFMPFIALYYERMGLSGVQIGTLAALLVLVTSSTALAWGSIADAFRLHRPILRVALLLAPLTVLALSTVSRYTKKMRQRWNQRSAGLAP